MKLKDVLRDIPALELHADPETEITDVCYDSRKVTPGALFVAVRGYETDGHKYIPAALEKLGITEPLYPGKLPEGFVITESHISKDPLVLMEQYARGDKQLSITVTPIKGFETAVYQKVGKMAQEYESGKIVHYIFETDNTVTAIWYTKHYATTISGNITREEIKEIIDSIHEGGA